jgi:Flp pilus assembly pilin Flp
VEVADVEEARESSGKRRTTGEEGQGLVEYSLILMLVSTAIVTALGLYGNELVTAYQGIIALIP